MKKIIKGIFLISFFFLLAYSVQYKKKKIDKKIKKTVLSFFSEWKKQGKPVFVKKMQPLNFEHKIKMTVSCFDKNLFYAYVSKDLFEKLKENHPVFLHYNEREIKGTIQKLNDCLHPEKGLYKVEGVFSSDFISDSSCIVDIPFFPDKKVFYLPQEVVHEKENQYYVWLLKNDRCFEKKIAVEEEKRGFLIVDRGIDENDFIVVRGNACLRNGDLVKVLNREQ